MKNISKILSLTVLFTLSCAPTNTSAEVEVWYKYGKRNYSVENSVRSKIPVPKGYKRIKTYKNSFAEWLRYLPVKSAGSAVLTYSGEALSDDYYTIWRVIDLPLYFRSDIEQCADWGYRFWYEYQIEAGFGDNLWMTDYNGNKKTYRQWKEGRKNPSLKKFFKWVCNHANSYSQKKGLYEVEENALRPGDLIVQNQTGGIGHVSVIFDICENEKGEKLYLVGYSFMPAQECHIEKADDEPGSGGWFTLAGYYQHSAGFGPSVLRSFIKQESLKLTDNPIENWQKYELAVRDSKISIEKAAALLPKIVNDIDNFAQRYEFNKADTWVFPVEGYSAADIGGTHGEGYQPDIRYGSGKIKGYSFFDGNRHGGHPAHDIFIHDENRDCIDDRTGEPVYAAAMMDGIVLSTYKDWKSGSKIRGGNYIWCYHPQANLVSYYAHLKDITVESGQRVSAGDRLGTIGRTGFSAEPARSPTHLHLMVLKYSDGELEPYNYYDNFR